MTILGLEHEYVVIRDGLPVDFRAHIDDAARDGVRLDPVDPFAHRMPDGSVLTCDGREAETAAPPIDLRPGFTHEICAWADRMAGHLAGHDLRGVSTHLSLEVPDPLTLPVCGLFARRFAPALMLLGEGPEGQGLLVRPRHCRVELGIGFTAGAWLRASAALAAGGVLACIGVAQRSARMRSLPPRVDAQFEGARARFGWYIDRFAYGPDLYVLGRNARLRAGRLRPRRADAILGDAWRIAARHLTEHGLAGPDDLTDGNALVAGDIPLHCEGEQLRFPSPASAPKPSRFGEITNPRLVSGSVVEAIAATWDFTLFRVSGAIERYVSVPRVLLPHFLDGLDRGVLEEDVGAEPILHAYAAAEAGGWFDDVSLGGLRPPERAYDGSFL